MRVDVLAAAVSVALTIGQAPSATPRPAPPDVGAGRIAWFDLTTTDLEQSRAFYGGLFGWTFGPVQGTEHAVEIVSGGTAIGTLRVAEGGIGAFNGVVYVQVDDIEAACAKAKALGASVAPGFPFNLTDRPGAIALLADPAGHPLGLYSRTPMSAPTPPDK